MKLAPLPQHRHLRVALLVLAAGALSVVLTQCRMVTDSALAPQVATATGGSDSRAGKCVSDCAHTYADAMRAEAELHVNNLHGCGGDEQCLDDENSRHTAAVKYIVFLRQQCMDRCHHQGGGHGEGH